jgi:hypothetical protein
MALKFYLILILVLVEQKVNFNNNVGNFVAAQGIFDIFGFGSNYNRQQSSTSNAQKGNQNRVQQTSTNRVQQTNLNRVQQSNSNRAQQTNPNRAQQTNQQSNSNGAQQSNSNRVQQTNTNRAQSTNQQSNLNGVQQSNSNRVKPKPDSIIVQHSNGATSLNLANESPIPKKQSHCTQYFEYINNGAIVEGQIKLKFEITEPIIDLSVEAVVPGNSRPVCINFLC